MIKSTWSAFPHARKRARPSKGWMPHHHQTERRISWILPRKGVASTLGLGSAVRTFEVGKNSSPVYLPPYLDWPLCMAKSTLKQIIWSLGRALSGVMCHFAPEWSWEYWWMAEEYFTFPKSTELPNCSSIACSRWEWYSGLSTWWINNRILGYVAITVLDIKLSVSVCHDNDS